MKRPYNNPYHIYHFGVMTMNVEEKGFDSPTYKSIKFNEKVLSSSTTIFYREARLLDQSISK